MIAITADSLLSPVDRIADPVVLVEDLTIAAVFAKKSREIPPRARIVNFPKGILAPGFLDMHIHGGAGHDVMRADKSGFAQLEASLASHGVCGYFPTTVTASLDVTLAALARMADAVEGASHRDASKTPRAVPLGIHLEGPFISHVRRGVHPTAQLLSPSLEMFDRFWQAARGQIRVMTIAPELDEAMEVIAEATHRGVCVSLGHSDADIGTTHRAIAAGARHATHTFNAMRPLNHRDPGILGEVLTNDAISADIIVDGVHLDPAIVRLFLRAKGLERSILITDAIAATDMADGTYMLGELEVEVKDGKCTHGGNIAGSVLTMDHAICNVMQTAGLDLQSAVQLASANPARVLGLGSRGRLVAGAVADFVVLNSVGEVQQTIMGGQL